MEACWRTDLTAVKLLLRHRAAMHATTATGLTAMLWAQWRLEAFEQHQGSAQAMEGGCRSERVDGEKSNVRPAFVCKIWSKPSSCTVALCELAVLHIH